VHDLLEVARQRKVGVTSDVDVTGLARSVAQRWQSAARDADRPLLVDGCAAPVHLAAGAVEQILDDLVRSALEHGSGPVRIDVEDLTDHVRVRVRDDSPPRVDVPAPARSVAEALGAHLTLDRGPTTSYTLRLPRAGVAAAVGGRPGPADGPIPTP